MNTRQISGVLFNLEGQTLKNASVSIELSPSTYTDAGVVQPTLASYKTDANGILTAELFVNEEGEIASVYTLYGPGNDRWSFTVPSGSSDLTWSQLRALGVTENDPQYQTLVTFVAQEIEEQLGTGGVFPTDPNGVLIVDAGLL